MRAQLHGESEAHPPRAAEERAATEAATQAATEAATQAATGAPGANAADEPPAWLGRYQILGRLARGGMAEVLLARATGPGGFARELVIKRLAPGLAGDAAAVRMFLDEARLSASLRHPHIVAVLEVEHGRDGAFMAMELLHGHDLRAVARRLVARRQRWPLPLAIHVVQAVCLGLHHAHEQTDERGRPLGIVHRDVSPHNVHVGYQGEVKVLDFGIARAEGRLEATRTGTIKGKLGYMSPDQCRGKLVDRRSDVFCLGILLCELTTGQRLFRGRDDYELLRATVEEPPRRPSADVADYPPELEAIALAALEADPARRTASAMALYEQLEEVRKLRGWGAGARELASFLRELFAEELAAWHAARGEPARQLAALRGSSESESASESESGSASTASASPHRHSQRATVTLTQAPAPSKHDVPQIVRPPRRFTASSIAAIALVVLATSAATWRIARDGEDIAPPAPAVPPSSASPLAPGPLSPPPTPVEPARTTEGPAAPSITPSRPGLSAATRTLGRGRARPPASMPRSSSSASPPLAPPTTSSGPPDNPSSSPPASPPSSSPPAAPQPAVPTPAPPPALSSPPAPAPPLGCKDDDCVL